MAFVTTGVQRSPILRPSSAMFSGMGSLGAIAPKIYEKTLPPDLPASQKAIIEAWIAAAIPKIKQRTIRHSGTYGGVETGIDALSLWWLATGISPKEGAEVVPSEFGYHPNLFSAFPRAPVRPEFTEFLNLTKSNPDQAIRYALNGLASLATAWPTKTSYGVVSSAIPDGVKIAAVLTAPAPPWYKATKFWWGPTVSVNANGFFYDSSASLPVGSTAKVGAMVFDYAWKGAKFWWKAPDGVLPNPNLKEGFDLIKEVSGWAPSRAGAEWMFPPHIWPKIEAVSGETWRLNKWAEAGNLRLEYHQRRGDPYVGSGCTIAGCVWFPYPTVRKQGYETIVTNLPTAEDYVRWVDWYNAIPYVAGHSENPLVLRAEVRHAVTGQVIKKGLGEEKALIVFLTWKAGASDEAKANLAIRNMLTPIPDFETKSGEPVDAFGIKTPETEEGLEERIMATPGASDVVDDIAVHPVLSELQEKADFDSLPTKTVIQIFGPVKDKRKKSFLKQYGVYIVAAVIVGAVIIAAIPAGGGAAATGAAGTTGTGAAGAAGAAGSAAGSAAAAGSSALTTVGAGSVVPLAATPGVTASGLLASAGKAIVTPAIKYGIAKAAGAPDAEKAALSELGLAVASDIMPLLAKEVLPDGTVELTQSAREFIDTYIPESVQDLAEAYLRGEVKREVVEWALGKEGYDLPSGRSSYDYTDLLNTTKQNQPYYGGTPVTQESLMKYAGFGLVGIGAILLLTMGGVPKFKAPAKSKGKSRSKPRKRR